MERYFVAIQTLPLPSDVALELAAYCEAGPSDTQPWEKGSNS